MKELTSSEKISKGMSLFAQGLGEVMNEFAKAFNQAFEAVKPILFSISKLQDKKLTKKKFMKLLQSEGIQRNQINEIIANNKEPFTYRRLSETLNLYKKDGE